MKKQTTTTTRRPLWGLGGSLWGLLLWGLAGSFSAFAEQPSHITVIPISADYSQTGYASDVTFTVTRQGTPTDPPTEPSKIWVWLDYKPIVDNKPSGAWQHATVAVVTAGTVAAGNQGFWLQDDTYAFSESVTATLNVTSSPYNWCVYASDTPPTAVLQPDGGYRLQGTAPFTVNGNINVPGTYFAAGTCITSLSDASRHPGYIIPDPPTVNSVVASTPCAGATASLTATVSGGTTDDMTYTWNIGGTQSTTNTITNTSQTLSGNTTYSVTVTNVNGCVSEAKTGTITVNTPPAAPTNPTVNAVCNEGNVTFGAIADAFCCTIDWYANANGGSPETDGADTSTITRYLQSSATYYAEARNTATQCVSSTRLPVTGMVDAQPTITSLTSSSATICNGESATLTAVATNATEYKLDNGDWQSASTFEVSPNVTTTYTLYVKSSAVCTASKANAATITVNELPAITLISAATTTAQTVTAGEAITQIQYATTDAINASLTNQPEGVSGTWNADTYTINGTPAATGIYAYTVTTDNSNNCPDASATGTITVKHAVGVYNCIPSTFTLGNVDFASTETHTRNGITISAPVTATYCQKNDYTGSSLGAYYADCRNNPQGDGDFFSWCTVANYAATLCPSPWRVPNAVDIYQLAGGDDLPFLNSGVDGWALNGLVLPETGEAINDMAEGYYWTLSEYDINGAVHVEMNTSTGGVGDLMKSYGLSLRCVRDVTPENLSLSSATICAGQSATLTASATNAASYSINGTQWQKASTFAVSPMGTTNYTLYAKTEKGDEASLPNAATVSVMAVPNAPTIDVIVPSAFGAAATFTAAGSCSSYTWDGDVLSTSGSTVLSNPPADGTYTATAYVTCDGCSSPATSVSGYAFWLSCLGKPAASCPCPAGASTVNSFCYSVQDPVPTLTLCTGEQFLVHVGTAKINGGSATAEYCTNLGDGWSIMSGDSLGNQCACESNAVHLPAELLAAVPFNVCTAKCSRWSRWGYSVTNCALTSGAGDHIPVCYKPL